MNKKLKLHVGMVEIQSCFWARIYLWMRRKYDGVPAIKSFILKDIDIELSGDIDVEVLKPMITEGNTNMRGLAAFLQPYLKTVLDKYVQDVNSL